MFSFIKTIILNLYKTDEGVTDDLEALRLKILEANEIRNKARKIEGKPPIEFEIVNHEG